jgi:hypothetical protein
MLIGELSHCVYVQTIRLRQAAPRAVFDVVFNLHCASNYTPPIQKPVMPNAVHACDLCMSNPTMVIPVTHDQSLVYEVDRVPYH